MANSYYIGSQVTCQATFKNASGVLTDPTTVTNWIKDPAGVETTPAVTHVSTGVYTFTFTTVLAGVHNYGFAGTGNLIVAAETQFVVLPTNK